MAMFPHIFYWLTIPLKATRGHNKNSSESAVSQKLSQSFAPRYRQDLILDHELRIQIIFKYNENGSKTFVRLPL